MKKIIFGTVALAFLLAGCSNVREVPVYTPVDVEKVVAVPCIEQHELPELPVLATTKIEGHESDCELVNMVLTDRAQLMLYRDQVQAVLAGCVKPASGEAVSQSRFVLGAANQKGQQQRDHSTAIHPLNSQPNIQPARAGQSGACDLPLTGVTLPFRQSYRARGHPVSKFEFARLNTVGIAIDPIE